MSGPREPFAGRPDPIATPRPARPPRAPLAERWALDPDLVFLNHGSFGACPRGVLAAKQDLRAAMESNPVAFLARGLEDWLAAARAAVGAFVGADPDDLAFVPNATFGIATALNALRLGPGDELLATDHEYNAALNALRVAALDSGARVVTVHIPLPVAGPDDVVERVLAAVTARTRLALLSHVTSPTALVFPVERLVPVLEARGVAVLVDGAHAPGMIPLRVEDLGASWYVGNLHKWCCAPKGAAFLHVRRDLQAGTRPLVVSHAANDPRPTPSPFRRAFDWTGTLDPTPYLATPAALAEVGAMLEGGWPAVMARNTALARTAQEILVRDRRDADRARGDAGCDGCRGASARVRAAAWIGGRGGPARGMAPGCRGDRGPARRVAPRPRSPRPTAPPRAGLRPPPQRRRGLRGAG